MPGTPGPPASQTMGAAGSVAVLFKRTNASWIKRVDSVSRFSLTHRRPNSAGISLPSKVLKT
jgi:hypothetical protein